MPLSGECSGGDYEFHYLPPTDYDENGDEQYGEDEHMCEVCADLYFSLEELGFCIDLGDDMRALVEEYAEMVKHGEL